MLDIDRFHGCHNITRRLTLEYEYYTSVFLNENGQFNFSEYFVEWSYNFGSTVVFLFCYCESLSFDDDDD